MPSGRDSFRRNRVAPCIKDSIPPLASQTRQKWPPREPKSARKSPRSSPRLEIAARIATFRGAVISCSPQMAEPKNLTPIADPNSPSSLQQPPFSRFLSRAIVFSLILYCVAGALLAVVGAANLTRTPGNLTGSEAVNPFIGNLALQYRPPLSLAVGFTLYTATFRPAFLRRER